LATSPNAIKLARRCIQIATMRRVQLDAPAGSRESARVFAGRARTARRDTLAGQRAILHDLAPIWEDLIDRIRHVDERSVKEGCGMPDSLKPVKSYDWTDQEWLRLMREVDPKEEISAIERRVAEWRGAADDDAG
jgi:hypothetical protein